MNILYRFLRAMVAVLAMMGVPWLAHAQGESIGVVKTVSGEAFVVTQGKSVKAQPGTPVFMGSQLKTGARSSLGVTMKDNTVMSFGPDTEMTVDEYLYAPAQGQLKLGTNLSKGSMNYVSGMIAKLKPDAVSVKTPGGIIGVRGTQFVVKVDEPRPQQ